MSNFKDKLKNKVRSSAHTQLIEAAIIPVIENNVDINKNIQKETIKKPTKKKKFEETHTRQTYYIENDLLKKLRKLAGNEKGEKTRIINEALKMYINQNI